MFHATLSAGAMKRANKVNDFIVAFLAAAGSAFHLSWSECCLHTASSSSSSSSRTYRLTWHKLDTIASRTRYTNYREKIKLMGRIW